MSVIKTLAGTIDGVNATFTTPDPFQLGSFRLVWDGIIYPPDDVFYGYSEVNNTTVLLVTPPPLSTVLQGHYELVTAPPSGWSYSGNPLSSSRDLVRFLIGDTLASRPLLKDLEIDAVLSFQPNPVWAAAACADAIANLFASKVDKAIGQTRISLSQQVKHYQQMADRFRAGGPGNLPGGDGSAERVGGIFVGGVDKDENQSIRDDASVEQPSFNVGQDDHPGNPLNRPTRTEWDTW